MRAPAADEPFHIRLAAKSDIALIAEIEKNVFPDPWSKASFMHLLGETHARVSVAERGDSVVGYAVALFVADEGELANIAVRPEERGRGVGAALLEDALAEGWRRGANNIYLEVRALNDTAQALYERAGFREVGRRARYYSRPVDDAIMMVKARPI